MIFVFGISVFLKLKRIKKIPSENGSILGKKELEFTTTHILCKAELSQSTVDWKAIKHLKESKTAFYLYMDTNMAVLIPKRFFSSKEEISAFKTMVNEKIG